MHILKKPSVIVVVLLPHIALFDDDREYVADHTDGNKDPSVEIDLSYEIVNLNDVLISVPDHVAMHQCKQSVAADSE